MILFLSITEICDNERSLCGSEPKLKKKSVAYEKRVKLKCEFSNCVNKGQNHLFFKIYMHVPPEDNFFLSTTEGCKKESFLSWLK